MRTPAVSKKLMAVFTISVLASFVIPMALANSFSAPTPVIPSVCTSAFPSITNWSLIINGKMTIKNDEDSGFPSYWALDNYQKTFVIWEGTPTAIAGTPETFCALQQYIGTFKTFAGALSPQTGVEQPFGATGSEQGAIVYTFTGTFLGPYCHASSCPAMYSSMPLFGGIGTYNFGGSSTDILKNSYNTQTGDTTYIDYLQFYFSNPSSISSNDLSWAWIYTLGSGVGYGNMWVNANGGSFGDIVT